MNLIERAVAPIISEILLIMISFLLVVAVIFMSMDILNNSHLNSRYDYIEFMLNQDPHNITLNLISGNVSVPFTIYITNFQNVSEKIYITNLSVDKYYIDLYGKNITMQIFSLSKYYFTAGDFISFLYILDYLNSNQIISLHFMIIVNNGVLFDQPLMI